MGSQGCALLDRVYQAKSGCPAARPQGQGQRKCPHEIREQRSAAAYHTTQRVLTLTLCIFVSLLAALDGVTSAQWRQSLPTGNPHHATAT